MKRKVFKHMMLPAIVTGLLFAVVARSANSPAQDKLRRFEIQNLMQTVVDAADEATRATEKQRSLVKSLIGKAIGNAANDGAKSPQTGRLTSREVAREKAVLQQLEANARGFAEVLESVKRLAAEIDRQPGQLDGIKNLVAVTQLKAQTASDEASRAAGLVKSLIGKANGNAANDGNQSPQTGRLTPRELAREKAVLQQLEANARRAAEVLESVKRLAAEVDRQPRR